MTEVDVEVALQNRSAETGSFLVAAIVLGTSFSGFAFSFRDNFKRDPLEIFTHTFTTGVGDLMSEKTPTCILFDQDLKFVSFGFKAENRFYELALDGKNSDYYYFRQFKAELFGKMELSRSINVTDVTGIKSMPAMTVFSESIRYLKDILLEDCKKNLSGSNCVDIRWVITVPGVWNDKAKQFMREAVEMAGIVGDKMVLALEAEVASIYGRELPLEKLDLLVTTLQPFKEGSKYLIFDAGGGIIDVTMHEVDLSGNRKELHSFTGWKYGGAMVDSEYMTFLEGIVSEVVMMAFKTNYMSNYLDILHEFEMKKLAVQQMGQAMVLKMPVLLDNLLREKLNISITEALASMPKYKKTVKWIRDKLWVDFEVIKVFFQQACEINVKRLQSLLATADIDIDIILMTGGFSQSVMLQEAMIKNFPNKRVIIPRDADIAVLKGAVLFGHNMSVITSRRSKFTYGVRTFKAFDPKIHPEEKKYINNVGEELCRDIFDAYIRIGDQVKVDTRGIVKSYKTTYYDQKAIVIQIYASDKQFPEFTTDHGVALLGSLTAVVDVDEGLDRAVTIKFMFGDTELQVVGTNTKTGKRVKAFFNFLE